MILQAQNIVKRYAGHTALNDVSIEVPKQCIYGLLGPNGAGKTSLIRIINQITGPDSGKVLFNGKPISRNDISHIGYLPEERGLYRKMKIGEQAMYLARLKGLSNAEAKKRLNEWFDRFEIQGWWNKKVEELSKGMAQKVQFITTVLHQPELLILDEPFSGFDPINASLVRDEILRLRNEGATIILSTHNMASVEEICDKIALINLGHKVLEGNVKDIRNNHRSLTYQMRFKGEMISFVNALWTNFELLDKSSDNDEHTVSVKLGERKTLNDLLSTVIPVCQIEEVKEQIPGMNEIFIQAVQQSTQEIKVA